MCTVFATAADGRAAAELSGSPCPASTAAAEVTLGQSAPIIRNAPEGREASLARWVETGFSARDWPGQARALARHPALERSRRCVVPFSAFVAEGTRAVWFGLSGAHPLACFAGIASGGSFAILRTGRPPGEIGCLGAESMPVVLTTRAEINLWLNLPTAEALLLCTPLREGVLFPQPSPRGLVPGRGRGHIPASWHQASATAPF